MELRRGLRVRLKRLAHGGVGGSEDGARIVARLGLRPGMRVADLGAGFGEFAFRIAAEVGPGGLVFAVDTDPDLREEVARGARRRALAQVHPIAASADDPGLPEPVDLVFLASSFHHLPDRPRYFAQLRGRIRPGGRVAILEPQPSLLTGWFGHATRPEEVRATLEAAGFRWLERADVVRWAPLQVFAAEG